uniref:TSC22 domain family protein 1 n=1 Tax=Timema monikensis TaxID=170555 RepID=A0A7R9HKI1_9NEOP|nr:unnamed protein product [Timema monikensis]
MKDARTHPARSERFKVVNIEKTGPFKRGRWTCLDYSDSNTSVSQHITQMTTSMKAPEVKESTSQQIAAKTAPLDSMASQGPESVDPQKVKQDNASSVQESNPYVMVIHQAPLGNISSGQNSAMNYPSVSASQTVIPQSALPQQSAPAQQAQTQNVAQQQAQAVQNSTQPHQAQSLSQLPATQNITTGGGGPVLDQHIHHQSLPPQQMQQQQQMQLQQQINIPVHQHMTSMPQGQLGLHQPTCGVHQPQALMQPQQINYMQQPYGMPQQLVAQDANSQQFPTQVPTAVSTTIPSAVAHAYSVAASQGTIPVQTLVGSISTPTMPRSVPTPLPDGHQLVVQNVNPESVPIPSAVAIGNKIEQAMDLVKSHLMFAVREEVEVLKEKIAELMERIGQLELENSVLKVSASQETLAHLESRRIQTLGGKVQQQLQASKNTD